MISANRVLAVVVLAGVVAATAFAHVGAPTSDAATGDRLPDLGMAQPADIKVERAPGGLRLLRYTSVIVNAGAGPFEVHGQRASTAETEMDATQHIFDTAGGYREVPTTARMVFGGDGHNHWHVQDLEAGDLIRLDNGSKAGTSAKHGFCFNDNTWFRLSLPGAPQDRVYTNCARDTDLKVTMGLSVGWGDTYGSTLPDQYVDISSVGPGRYRLLLTADAGSWFTESNESNNSSWVDLQIRGGNAPPKILGYGSEI